MTEKRGRGRPQKSPVEAEFIESVQSLDGSALKSKIVEINKYVKELKSAEKEDNDLQSLKEQVKTAREPYSAAFNGAAHKIDYLLELLASKGQ